ncbi:LysR family transcriptional regulator [Diaphorobacter sp. HDW4A]|uniref:LysR family transcriptional regulator n=1 Tax=Diaphorobacter sp. HDW4A TaxID=2714924 RepID=UPI00140D408B|nr:LysR family transcriptional regulator [Diaphorobacter sp. HDW4A]QIL83108.1 LysR family transcriptional regulator [Diaphorobacter sp. HDW4A]
MMNHHLPNFWQLRVFDCVAKLENVTRAAQELLRTQPAITTCILALEKALGATLFERHKTGIYLTEVGVAAHIRTKKILEWLEETMALLPGERKIAPLAIAARMTRSQVQALIAIHECHSFRGAAVKLGVTDASLQRSARTLEANLGCPLYRNTASGIRTTELADELAARLKHAEAQIGALADAIRGFHYPRNKSITLGVMLLDPSMLLVNAMKETRERYPDVRISVISGTYEQLVNKLLREELDFIVGLIKKQSAGLGLAQQPLYNESYCIVARRGHPLHKKAQITVADLQQYPWIIPPAGSPRRLAYEHLFSETTLPPAQIETYSLSTMRITLADSDMLTVLSWVEVLSERHFGLLAPLPFDFVCEEPAVGISKVQGKLLNESQQYFIDAFAKNAAVLRRA